MMKGIIKISGLLCLLVYLIPQVLLAQNLVPNPSFERYNSCPSTTSGLRYPNPPANPYPTVTDWSNPVNASTSDYFNACASVSSQVSVPLNTFGYSMARTGNAYVGLYAIEERSDGNYREYVMARLDQALQAGRRYYVSFYVSRAGMNTSWGSAAWYSDDNISTTADIGAYVSQRRVDEPQYRPLSFTPQAANPQGNYIDTTWTRVEGVMTAGGGERWITIGNFNPVNDYLTVAIRKPSDTTVPVCYFYIDDVCVTDITDSIRVHEVRKCGEGDVLLQPPQAAGQYRWNTGDTTQYITVQDTGVYWVGVAGECSYRVDTFQVYRKPLPAPHLGEDTTYCHGTEVRLSGDGAYGSFSWSTGDTTSSIHVRDAGVYVLTVTDGCEVTSDTITISYYPQVALPAVADTQFCLNETVTEWYFDTTGLIWYPGATGPALAAPPAPHTATSGTQVYWISRREGLCESERDPFAVHILAPPEEIALPDTTICEGEALHLSAGNETLSYLWHTGATGCCIAVSEPGPYYVDISNACGTVRAEGSMETVPCSNCVWLPTAFSPTGDGVNDVFRAVVRCPVSGFELRIFNRWGQLVFTTVDPAEGWDGLHAGTPAPVGVYYYLLQAEAGMPGWSEKITLKGDVHLIR
jgi:gliding motility-associated-like protein